MNSSRAWIALYFAVLTLLVSAIGWSTWHSVHIYPGTPETEGAFLKHYTPVEVLNKFNNSQAYYSNGGGDTAGSRFVTHTATFEGNFALCSEQFMPLMNALSDDVAAQLVKGGAHITSQIGVAEAGFHFDYKLGKTLGSVTVAPLQLTSDLSTLSQSIPQPKCMAGVKTRIDVVERWFPNEAGFMRVSVNKSIQ